MNFLFDKIRVDPSQTPILVSDQNQQNDDKEKIIELTFENFQSPAFFSSKRSALSLFANGKTTGFVYSSGAELTELIPICDGYILKRGMSSFNHGGESITREVLKFLEQKATNPIYPHFDYEFSMNNESQKESNLLKLDNVTDSMRRFFKMKIAREAKEEFVRVHTDTEEK